MYLYILGFPRFCGITKHNAFIQPSLAGRDSPVIGCLLYRQVTRE